MFKKNISGRIMLCIASFSFVIKLILIFMYGNQLTLSSDDLNYVKSAVVLMKTGVFTFHNYNEPTVFIMPLYPFFLAAVFKIFGYGLYGLQVVRLIQAIFSCLTIVLVYLIGKFYFNEKIAIIAAAMMAFYIPNIVTIGYMLTETLFTTLLCLLIYLSLKYLQNPSYLRFAVLGVIWTLATLCRPTIALYPILLLFYILIFLRMKLLKTIQYGCIMLGIFIIIMSPWWLRNYREYGELIPLAASSGNPMLQGTYVDYKQTPENIVYYSLGKNAFETNKSETETAIARIKNEFRKDFWGYLGWYTLGKTYYLWHTVFYWKAFFGIGIEIVQVSHYFILLGFCGIFVLSFKNILRYVLPISVLVYFNIVHCVYMAFDRYAFPLLPLLAVFSAYFIYRVYCICKSGVLWAIRNAY